MKTKEEMNALKAEFEAMKEKLAELTEDELKQVTGGTEETEQQPCPKGYTWVDEWKCKDCPDKTLINITPNCFETYSCDYGHGTFNKPKETNLVSD